MFSIPIYKVLCDDESDEIDFNAVVDYPAHSKHFDLFGKKSPVKQHFNNDKRIVTGVAIATDVPIYRNDPIRGEYYLYFSAEETFKLAERMFERNYIHNVNEMHDTNKGIKGMTLVESYFIDYSKGKTPPTAFKDQNLKDGTWIVSYKVNDPATWEKLRSGIYQGFSVEGWFTLVKQNFKNKNKTKNMKKTFFENIKALLGEGRQNFGEAITTDNATVVWEGDLSEGTELRIKAEDGTEILAPEGMHAILNEDGTTTVVKVDENGIVTSVETIEATDEAAEVIEVVEIMSKQIFQLKKANAKHEATIKAMKVEFNAKVETLSEIVSKAGNKQIAPSAKGWKSLVK